MEKYYFFDSNTAIGDRRLYSAADWSKVLSKFLENGIYVEGDNLSVTADGSSMAVTVGTGVAFIDGHMYENDASLTLNVDAAEATLDRIDLVVLRLDITEQNRYIKSFVVKGEAAAAPVAPVPVDTTFIKEIPLAEIRVTAGKSIVEQTQLTDKRPSDFVDPFADGSRITNLENVLVPQAEANAIKWAKSFGLGDVAKDISITDLNALDATGFYKGQLMTNAPSTNYFYIINLKHTSTYKSQIAIRVDSLTPLMFIRMNSNGTWSAWSQLETTAGAQAKADQAETDAINFAKGFGLGGNTVQLANYADLNTLDKTGFYSVFAPTNGPFPTTSGLWYVVINIQHNTSYQQQIAIPFSGSSVYESVQFTRNKVNGAWKGWREALYNEYPTWSNLPLQNGAIVKTAAQYTKVGSLVLVRGRISCPPGTTFATLPPDFIPSYPMIFKTALDSNTAGADATITLRDNGELYLNSVTSTNDIWLSGITFLRDFKG